MESTLKVRGDPPRVSNGRAGVAMPLEQACQEAGVAIEVGRLAVRRLRIFALPDMTGGLVVSPASIPVLRELAGRTA